LKNRSLSSEGWRTFKLWSGRRRWQLERKKSVAIHADMSM
jgi:hypothetical protein